jgi:hypothetical protein
MDGSGGALVTQIVVNLVVNCPLFLALVVGLAVGVVAFVRHNRLAGGLAFAGFAVLGLLLLLSTFLGGGQMAMAAYQQGVEPARVGLLTAGIGCVRSLVEMVGLLCIVGAIAVYVFRGKQASEGTIQLR